MCWHLSLTNVYLNTNSLKKLTERKICPEEFMKDEPISTSPFEVQ